MNGYSLCNSGIHHAVEHSSCHWERIWGWRGEGVERGGGGEGRGWRGEGVEREEGENTLKILCMYTYWAVWYILVSIIGDNLLAVEDGEE